MSLRPIGGWLPDPPDADDIPARLGALRALPVLFTGENFRIPARTPVSDQGQVSSCVGNAVADAFELIMPAPVVQLSRLFAYFNGRVATNSEGADAGTYIRDALKYVNAVGICPEAAWPYKPELVNVRPALDSYEQAYDHRIDGFFRIDATGQDRLDAVEAALRAGLPVVFGTEVGEEWERAGSSDTAIGPPAVSLGGHAQVIVGMRGKGEARDFLIRNSWGEYWGDHGHAWMTGEYIADPRTNDLWVITSGPSLEGG